MLHVIQEFGKQCSEQDSLKSIQALLGRNSVSTLRAWGGASTTLVREQLLGNRKGTGGDNGGQTWSIALKLHAELHARAHCLCLILARRHILFDL